MADVRKLVLTGFAVTNPQHTVNNPVYGLDNWIYLAHEGPARAIIYKKQFGDVGTDIRFSDRPDLAAEKRTQPERALSAGFASVGISVRQFSVWAGFR